MRVIDLHCDTLWRLSRPDGLWGHSGDLTENPYGVDVNRLEKADARVQAFAVFFMTGQVPGVLREAWAYRVARRRIKAYHRWRIQTGGRLQPIRTYEDVDFCERYGCVGSLLTLEDGVPFGNDLDRLREFYDLGVRLVTLTWNYENAIGFPNSSDATTMTRGLKPFGREALEEMNRLGILVDVSHLSDGGFWDVARLSKKPFIASHSNARAVTDHPRNLTDRMIRTIAEKGGVVGLNFCPSFLSDRKVSTINGMLRHVHHIYQVGGEDVLALGSDLDGVSGKLQIKSCDQIGLLAEALKRHKMSHRVLEKMWSGNAQRVLREVLR
ncbi:MAG: dipeptidase [Blautia sp.]